MREERAWWTQLSQKPFLSQQNRDTGCHPLECASKWLLELRKWHLYMIVLLGMQFGTDVENPSQGIETPFAEE